MDVLEKVFVKLVLTTSDHSLTVHSYFSRDREITPDTPKELLIVPLHPLPSKSACFRLKTLKLGSGEGFMVVIPALYPTRKSNNFAECFHLLFTF